MNIGVLFILLAIAYAILTFITPKITNDLDKPNKIKE